VTFSYTIGRQRDVERHAADDRRAGVLSAHARRTNGVAPPASQAFTLSVVCPVIAVTPTTLTNAILQQAYDRWRSRPRAAAGKLRVQLRQRQPPGLAFTGANLGGTPTTAGTYTFDVIATDTATGCTGARTFSSFQVIITANNDNYGNIVGNVLAIRAAARRSAWSTTTPSREARRSPPSTPPAPWAAR
jgi:hypothetical protein